MKFKALSCNKSILKKNLSRFWPAMLLLGLLLSLLYLFPLPLNVANTSHLIPDSVVNDLVEFFKGATVEIVPVFSFGYAVISACLVYDYLHKARMSNMLHALPLTRDILFATSYLSGLLLFLIPYGTVSVLSKLLMLCIEISGALEYLSLFLFDLFAVLQFIVFYSLAVFCVQLCGRRGIAILCYGVLNFLAPILEGAFLLISEPYLFGVSLYDDLATWFLCPLYSFLSFDYSKIIYETGFLPGPIYDFGIWQPWVYLGISLVVSTVLLAVSSLLYRRRRIEAVGQGIVFSKAFYVVRYILTLFIALYGGALMYEIMFSFGSENSSLRVVICLLVGFLGHYLVEMLLTRNTRVFNWKVLRSGGLFALSVLAVVLCFRFDVFGIVRNVPDPQSVRELSLQINGAEITVRDIEQIEAFCKLHEEIIDHRDILMDTADRELSYWWTITYRLNNNETLKREYDIYTPHSEDNLRQQLPELQGLWHDIWGLFASDEMNLLYLDQLEEATDQIYIYDYDGRSIHLSKTERERFYDALRKDLLQNEEQISYIIQDQFNTDIVEFKDPEFYVEYRAYYFPAHHKTIIIFARDTEPLTRELYQEILDAEKSS